MQSEKAEPQGRETMKDAIRRAVLPALVCLSVAAWLAPTADADRALLSEAALETAHCIHCTDFNAAIPPSEGQIEGPCGLAISSTGQVYLADYYQRVVDVFRPPSAGVPGMYISQIALPGANPRFGVNTLDSVCGLAFDAAGNLYGNEWHQGAVRLTGGEATIDDGESTGIAIDSSTDRLYVDDRTYVAEYALPFTPGDVPLAALGSSSLGDAYGLAAAAGRVYVADASDQTVEVFEPAGGPAPIATIAGPFNSLTDAALAVDPTNGHLLVVDNAQPGFEHPESSLLEFDSFANGHAFLGRLPGAPIHGGPSGVAVDASGQVIVTDGNGELSNAFLYGPYSAVGTAAALESPRASFATSAITPSGANEEGAGVTRRSPDSASASEVNQRGGVRVRFQGRLSPRTLPRHGHRPVVASVGASISAEADRTPPQLRRIEIAINRNGHFSPGSVSQCRIDQIQPATTSAALASCRRALVGEGHFSARVLLPQQAPFPSSGKVYAFNGRWHGKPAVLAHVYGTEPVPVSYTIPFELLARQRGTYGTLLRASLPAVTGDAGYVTGLSLTFGRGPRAGGYITAACPAPPGLGKAVFPFARVDFSFAGGPKVGSTLIRSCKGKG
jgi:DNA-binding beta-propeller fold protein YncE